MNAPHPDPEGPSALSSGLKPRHVTMISIAGVIGAGLFVGSAAAIKLAGPSVLISYALAGTLVVLVMRMLGEMATANPDSGSFSVYADRALGRWAGFSIGWLYWWFWVLVIPVEATAGAKILSGWIDWPQWVFALIITALLTVTNLFSVANYGEFEFWFALVKVVAIVGFIGLGVLAILGILPGSDASGLHGFTDYGFFADGWSGVLAAMLTTMFTFMGTEIVTIAAAESNNPVEGIRKAVNSVIWRISLFYLGSIFVVIALTKWNSASLQENGSYQEALNNMGLSKLATVLAFVILTAVAWCLNSALYTASRMAYSLGQRGDAPKAFASTNKRGVPQVAILASVAVGFLAVFGNYLLPEKIFTYLLSTSGAIALFVYIVIAVTQLRARAAMDKTGARPAVRMWAFPVLTYVTIAFIVFTLGAMALREDQQLNLFLTLGLAAVVIGIGVAKHGFRGGSEDEIIRAVESADTAEVADDVATSGPPRV
ncbi:amino acid permease [Dermacoccus abyssi]|uniref:amino acid permease n=1 Tax=Dermacoccus abyssi TaxID=322596 RepID=UPI0021A2B0ED|nr:amino acid permease [Dermacoccus abyssi]MCT1988117.1 amino acid permease [Dermacoccus abyssi]